MIEAAVLHELVAVIGHRDHDRAIEETRRAHFGEEAPETLVRLAHLLIVERQEEFRVVPVERRHEARRSPGSLIAASPCSRSFAFSAIVPSSVPL